MFLIANAAKQRIECQRFLWVEAGGGLIEAEKFRFGAHGTGNFQTALCTIGKITSGIVGALDQIGFSSQYFAFSIAASAARL